MKTINKKAYYNYSVVESYIAGLMLTGSEVKSIRIGNVNFGDSFLLFKDGELYIRNLSISTYKESSYQNHEVLRDRKVLLKKKEIKDISLYLDQKGVTSVPLEIFEIKNRIKVKVGICRGKKSYDKKQAIKEKDIEREVKRENGYNL